MSARFDVVTLGESMIRLAPPNFERISQAVSLDIQIGGAESNVAIALSKLGFHTSWLSRLPQNALGERVIAELRRHGVDASGVKMAPGERIGTYFIELATPPRPNRVIYDRAGSAASRMSFDDVDASVLGAARWVHLTGITPALGASCRDMIQRTIAFAKQNGATVSFDVNYRALLWSANDAGAALEPMLQQCDHVFCAHRDAVNLFGAAEEPYVAARQLHKRFGVQTLVLTLGEDGAIAVQRGADGVLVETHQPQNFKVTQMVDRIGAGDAFDSGFIAGQLWGLPLQECLSYGNAMSAMKITIPGDLALFSKDEIDAPVAGGRSASVR
ncbi:MAG: sugar kinase [Chloroflexi bacterium]|nr:sugar kinase [Chloroflexota bacterium]